MSDSSKIQLAFKTQLFANNKQQAYFAKACGVSRFCWNWGLAHWNEQYQAHRENSELPKPNGKALKKQLNAIKKSDFPWMYEVTKYAAQQPFIHLDRAFKDWIKDLTSNKPKHLKKSRPTFKKKGKSQDSFYVGGDQVKVVGDKVKVPNLGCVTMAEPIKYGGHWGCLSLVLAFLWLSDWLAGKAEVCRTNGLNSKISNAISEPICKPLRAGAEEVYCVVAQFVKVDDIYGIERLALYLFIVPQRKAKANERHP